MSASRLCLLAVATASVLAPVSKAAAQAYGMADFVEHADLNWFEPNELDLDGSVGPNVGYFLNYDRLYWNFAGDNTILGTPGLTVQSEQIYRPNTPLMARAQIERLAFGGATPEEIEAQSGYLLERDGMGDFITTTINIVDDDGMIIGTVDVPQIDPTDNDGNGVPDTIDDEVPSTYTVQNGIQDALPDAVFAWGDRYEFGYTDGERGWKIGILDGPTAKQEAVYGAGLFSPYGHQGEDSDANGISGGYESGAPDDDGNGVGDGDGPIGELYALGFGSVAVNFTLENPDLLLGFRDYQDNVARHLTGTGKGPIVWVGNTGFPEEDGDLSEDLEFEFEGGISDDVDNDTQQVTYIVADLDGDGEVDDDELIGVILDYGDLHEFNTRFSDVTVRNTTQLDGVEWMMTHDLSTNHKMDRGRRDHVQLQYGVRYLRLHDEFFFDGRGGILDGTAVDMETRNQIVGPQIGLTWTRTRGMWDFNVDGRFMFGYNVTDMDQDGIVAEGTVPGAVNRSATLFTTTSNYGVRRHEFSPVGELRAEARYKFSKGVSLMLGYNAKIIENVRRASQSVDWNIPNWGILSDEKSEILIHGLNMGVEVSF